MSHGFWPRSFNLVSRSLVSTICGTLFVMPMVGKLVAEDAPVPTLEMTSPEPLGLTGITANGRIHPHGRPTTYYFEYGPTATYGSKTKEHSLPPRLAAFYHESWDQGAAGWMGGMNGKDLVHHADGGASKGFVRFTEPSGNDPNHVDGIGTLHLASYFYPASHPSGLGYQALWGGADPDLRDARVKIQVRGNKWQPNGSECVWWTQSDNDLPKQMTPNWRRANWAYTGFSLNDFFESGNWEKVEYRLNNNSRDWTYGGNNLAQKRPNYEYDSINNSLGRLSCDFFHLLAYVNPNKLPEGSIDFDEFELAYRNYSLLLPSNGGQLTSSPTGAEENPAALTDGWRNGPGHTWKSAAAPKEPLEFIYAFANPVVMQTIQIHQHPEWPCKQVEVLSSDDGKNWKSTLSKEIPETSPGGPNFNYLLARGLNVPAKHVKIRIVSGYKPEHWGLGEIEIFGTGAVMQTDDDWYNVNLDLNGLKPGESCHYRLVATSSAGTTTGPDQTFAIPADVRPHVVTGPATRIKNGTAKLEGRLNPMGKKSDFYFEYGPDTNYGQKTPPQYGGLQITPRTSFATIGELKPGTMYHYRLVGVNEAGTSYGADGVLTAK